ncbi:LacI family DNA-binding transcriptional regulator [Fulvimarina sp. MAC8]|uniref:LacI family DNA-binding transcriptional regulator n=1 Tax=Fulvimarina sp. MAC8 TaxID=3162874 RepID=UPI0032EA9321
MDGIETVSKSKQPRTRPNRSRGGVTMAMVGRIAGVSQVTVSRALSDPTKVSAETLRRIETAIEQTGFVPNALAGALASRKSQLISAFVPSITNIVYTMMMQAFSERMRAEGYQILLSETGFELETEEKLIATHLARRPDAVLLTGIHHSARTRRMLLAMDVPVIEIWDMTDTPIDACVGFSHKEAGEAVAAFAVEAGYRRAASIAATDERAKRRQSGFAGAFEAATGQSVPTIDSGWQSSIRAGRDALSRLIDEKGFESGLIACSSDLLAHGVLVEATARGLKVPDTIAIFGFGDQDFAAHIATPLTTIKIDRSELGYAAASIMLDRLTAKTSGPVIRDIGFEIIRRASA